VSLSIGVDIGGTKVLAGVVDEAGAVLDRELRPTPGQDVADTERVIVEVVAALSRRHEVASVGIGAAGWIGADRRTVLFSPHLAWRHEPLHDALAERIGRPLIVENDANAAAWAEYRFGAAQGEPVVVCLTLGTGIGGGLVLAGRLFRGAFGVGAEFGHLTVVPEGRACACGNRGCWEMYASGTALARDAQELAAASPVAAHALLSMAGGDCRAIDGPTVTEAARAGDPVARGIYTEMGRWLGRGMASVAAALDPSVFVVGGGVSAAGDELLLAPAREVYGQTLAGRGFRPAARIELARFGPEAGLVGAADLARVALTEGPAGTPTTGTDPADREDTHG
jgi:glucokinase